MIYNIEGMVEVLGKNELIHIEGDDVVSWVKCGDKSDVDSVMVQLLFHLDPFQYM